MPPESDVPAEIPEPVLTPVRCCEPDLLSTLVSISPMCNDVAV